MSWEYLEKCITYLSKCFQPYLGLFIYYQVLNMLPSFPCKGTNTLGGFQRPKDCFTLNDESQNYSGKTLNFRLCGCPLVEQLCPKFCLLVSISSLLFGLLLCHVQVFAIYWDRMQLCLYTSSLLELSWPCTVGWEPSNSSPTWCEWCSQYSWYTSTHVKVQPSIFNMATIFLKEWCKHIFAWQTSLYSSNDGSNEYLGYILRAVWLPRDKTI